MSLLDENQKSATLPEDWHAAWEGMHPTEGNSYFVIRWQYPFSMKLANGNVKVFKSYSAHSNFVKEACLYYFKQGKRHISTL